VTKPDEFLRGEGVITAYKHVQQMEDIGTFLVLLLVSGACNHFANEGWFNGDQVIILMCLMCLLDKKNKQYFIYEKDATSMFQV